MSIQFIDRGLELFNSIPSPPLEIYNPHNNRKVAWVTQNGIFIKDRREKETIERWGINIPPFLKERFNNAKSIHDDNPFFYEAFITAECWNLLRDGYRIRKLEPADTHNQHSSTYSK